MALFNFGKKKEEKKTPTCCCGSEPKVEESTRLLLWLRSQSRGNHFLLRRSGRGHLLHQSPGRRLQVLP